MRSTWALVSVPIAVTRVNTHCNTSKTAILPTHTAFASAVGTRHHINMSIIFDSLSPGTVLPPWPQPAHAYAC
ncbi:uncharacterized protein IWZ02DRAFT_271434 [Phyllosticta citriasiana]|uniref:uncharacterized protein n=1 Tax=Phyllosticta citriasiana TaxID=595635 RepID=UPI0030FD2A27